MSDLHLRVQVIRLAAAMPQGSEERKALLDVLASNKEASGTWNRRIEPLQSQFLNEIVLAANKILSAEDAFAVIKTGPNFVRGRIQDMDFSILWQWAGNDILSKMSLGTRSRAGRHEPLSMSPDMVAANSIYQHHQGLLP